MDSMPARPAWIGRINEICTELERLPRPFVDRSTLEALLQVGRRRAQQIAKRWLDEDQHREPLVAL
jgi:hypothetical protein